MKLLFVANCPLPYQTPVLNALAEIVDLQVLYMTSPNTDQGRGADWGAFKDRWGEAPKFSYEFAWSYVITIPKVDFRTQVSAGISRRLRALRPDVLLLSSWSPLMAEPVLWAKATGRRSVMWAESSISSGLLRDPVTNAVRRALLSQIDAFVSNGSAASEYLRVLGIDGSRVVTSRLPSPLRSVASVVEAIPTAPAKTYLFVGRFVPLKRIQDALDAFALTVQSEKDARLIVAGDGPGEAALRQALKRFGPHASYVGRLEGEELSAIYLSADVLVVPSEREVWGLVVNEGLAHGLYVIASGEVGAAADLIKPETGHVYEVGNVEQLAQAMHGAPRATPESRIRTLKTMETVTPRRFASDILKAAEMAVRGPEPQPVTVA